MSNFIDLHCHSTFSSAMTAGDAAWLAGLLEGEGWFGERRQKGRSPRPLIALKMTDRDVVERVAVLCGNRAVSHTVNEDKKDFYTVRIGGQDAVEIMKLVLPWMGERRTETIEMLIWLHDGHKREVKCECGKCRLCRNREATRNYRKRQRV